MKEGYVIRDQTLPHFITATVPRWRERPPRWRERPAREHNPNQYLITKF